MPATGRCLCGDVAFTVDGPLREVVNCHCHRCRRWSGHYWAATNCPTDALVIHDETEALTWYSPAPGIGYGFCSHCGSSLFWRLDSRPESVSISAGCLEQPTGLTTTTSIWMAEHGDYHTPIPHLLTHEFD